MQSEKFISSIKSADLAACDAAGTFLQSGVWGRFKSRFGWAAAAFIVEWEHSGTALGAKPLLALFRRIAPGVSMAYIPWGPQFPAGFPDEAPLKAGAAVELARCLRQFLPRTIAFIRFDPPWQNSSASPFLTESFKRAAADIQPPDTVLLDLNLSLDDILAAMKPKWRYNIGLAEKRGVTVKCSDENDIELFFRLLGETAQRDGIAVHRIEYYRALFIECRNDASMQMHLYIAEHEGDALAAIVVLFRGKDATYLYGASSSVKRNLMAPYALQWKAVQDAKEYGCTAYDLFGIPPDENPGHPMAGLYRFKTGFGGRIIHRPGSWDYPCKPALYALFSGLEALRKKIRDRRKRRA